MNNSIVRFYAVLFLILTISLNTSAQEIKGGTVEYEQTNYHKFEKVGKQNIDNFISKLPSSTIDHKVLVFNSKSSLYKQGYMPEDPTLARQKMGINRLSFLNPPVVKLREVYIDLRNGEKIKQLEFMTRFFLMEEKTGHLAWKIGTEQVKILDYTCQKASMEDGDQTITAWFTPEIPLSIGPANYEGLPGLILSVEIDGKNTFLATSVDLTMPDQKIKKIREGTKVDQKKLHKIVAEKTKEWASEREEKIWGKKLR